MKVLGFIIHSNILIALAALSLALATQVQLGLKPQFHPYLAVIFLATLFDYNFHRYLTLFNKPEAVKNEKLKWASEHLMLFRTLILSSLIGLVIVLFFVKTEILFLLIPLALLSFLYSFPFPDKLKNGFRLLRIPGMKTFLIALVWTSATVLIPVFFEEQSFNIKQMGFLFAERFTFIFGIAIPFDIRDMETDALASIKTIPIQFGESNALLISNISLVLSISIATIHYLNMNMIFILPAFLFSIVSTYIFINNNALKKVVFYYHGILDGCILLHGILIFASFYILL